MQAVEQVAKPVLFDCSAVHGDVERVKALRLNRHDALRDGVRGVLRANLIA